MCVFVVCNLSLKMYFLLFQICLKLGVHLLIMQTAACFTYVVSDVAAHWWRLAIEHGMVISPSPKGVFRRLLKEEI